MNGKPETLEQIAANRKHMAMHAIAFLTFAGGILALSILVNGANGGVSSQLSASTSKDSSDRSPAMLRFPFARTAQSVLKSIGSVLHCTKKESPAPLQRFGLGNPANDFSRGLNVATVQRVEPVGFNYAAILPPSLAPATDGANVATQILDHSVSNLMKQETFRNSFVGKAATTVEETMRADVNFGGHEPESTKHNLKFQMKATDAKAKMEYTGLTNAEVSYSVARRQVDVEVYEPLSTDSKIVFSHSNKPSETQDMLSLRLNW
ncbi:MAG: hypothetical protein IPJ84_13640 [Bdellovibrionales bacterium]|nr:hypothetical protein [Bdellovibrionales bacterium]